MAKSQETYVPAKVMNVHTREVHRVVKIEVVSNPPITVYVLDNGDRWEAKQFYENWETVDG